MPSDRYAFIDLDMVSNGYTVYLLTLSEMVTVTTGASTVEAAVTSLLAVAPPDALKGVYVMNYVGFQTCRRNMEALRNAGYTTIEAVDVTSLSMSSFIYNLPLNCAIGDVVYICVWLGPMRAFTVVQKCENGWKTVMLHAQISEALDRYPSFRHVVYYEGASDEDKALIRDLFPGCQLHSNAMIQPDFKVRFVRNRINKGNLNGYEVLSYCRYALLIKFGDKRDTIPLSNDVPPFTISKKIDVGDAPFVEIRVDENGETLVKTFKFKSTAFRTVSITVNVDKTLVPQVSLKTIKTREPKTTATVPPPATHKTTSANPQPVDLDFSVIFNIMNMEFGFLVAKLDYIGSSDVVPFPTINNVIAYMRNQTSNFSTAVVNFNITAFDGATIPELKTFRDNCRKVGFSDVRMIPYKSTNFSLILSMLKINVQHNQSVALLYPEEYTIIVRDGGLLKVRDHDLLNISKINSYNVDRVIIMNLHEDYTKAQLADLKNKLRSTSVHIVKELSNGDDISFLLNSDNVVAQYTFNNFCDFDIDISGHKQISTRFKEIPFSVSEEVSLRRATSLEVHLLRNELKPELLKSFTVKRSTRFVRIVIQVESAIDITVTMDTADAPVVSKTATDTVPACKDAVYVTDKSEFTQVQPFTSNLRLLVKSDVANRSIDGTTHGTAKNKKSGAQRRKEAEIKASKREPTTLPDLLVSRDDKVDEVDSMTPLPTELSQLKLDPPPTTILTFTSDNHVLIKADESYTGVKEVLAYVRLQDGKTPKVGKQAFDALKKHPDSVFYDITRLLATDFDPDYPNPSWRFKTSCDADGKVVIRGGDGITTFPIVLFGLVVRSTLLYIQEHVKSEVTSLGIQLPMGSTISDADLNLVAQRIGVALVIC